MSSASKPDSTPAVVSDKPASTPDVVSDKPASTPAVIGDVKAQILVLQAVRSSSAWKTPSF